MKKSNKLQKKKLLIIRHARSKHNEKLTKDLDSQLTDFGVYQAVRTGIKLAGDPKLNKLPCFTSPFLRCLRTADLISAYCPGISRFKIYEPIHESRDEYPLDGCHVPNRKVIFKDFDWSDYPSRGKHFGRETKQQLITRMKEALEGLPDESLIISHGTPIMMLALLASGEDLDYVPEWDDSIINCSLTLIENGELKCWGHTDHLT